MKARCSAAALALQLVWKPVLLTLLAVPGIQCAIFWTEIGSDFGSAVQPGVTLVGKLGFAALLVVLILMGHELGGSKFSYTLRRLRVSERGLTLFWAAVFSGIFLLYWAVQLGLMLGLWSWFSRGMELESTALLVLSYDVPYFHLLLPLAEGWGYARNVAMCVGAGCFAALAAHNLRHGRNGLVPVIFLTTCGMLVSGEMSTRGQDIAVVIFTAMEVILYWLMIWRGDVDEETENA